LFNFDAMTLTISSGTVIPLPTGGWLAASGLAVGFGAARPRRRL
jgi:hypothetical protein